jgi:dihydroorotase
MTVLLKNGSVIDKEVKKLDVLIEGDVISAVGANITARADETIDCTGLAVFPGICDMHVHLRDPGQTHKEDLFSGAQAAAAGGVTAVMCMPNTSPVIDTPEAVRDLIERGAGAAVKIYPCAAITKGLQGRELCDFAALKRAGAVAVSDDGRPVEDSRVMLEAMLKAGQAGLRVISHCEDLRLMPEFSRASENVATAREICLAGDLRNHIHIAHVSTKEAIAYIRAAVSYGIMVTCETAPHYFTLTGAERGKRDGDYLMNPPLRELEDVVEITRALYNGSFDCIASDHAPHTPAEKADFDTAPNGVLGLETLLPVTLTQLYHTGGLSLPRIVQLLCVNPRRILGIPGGYVREGCPADAAIVDLDEEWTVNPDELHSKSRNTCFKGMTLKGRVKYTLVDGKIVFTGGRNG